MRRDLKAFSESIVALIKTSGDTGDSGDRTKKSNHFATLPISTNPKCLSPLDPEWRRALSEAGDRIAVYSEEHNQTVATVATALSEANGGAAPDKALLVGLAKLREAEPLEGFSFREWRNICDDGEAFVRRWAAEAAGLSWSDLDIFGVHPRSPAGRVGCWGVALLVQGGAVEALNIDGAVIRRRSGARLVWDRDSSSERVPIWQLL